MPVKIGLAERRKLYLKEKLKEIYPRLKKLNPEKVILFGFLAKGNSDIDLIIIAKNIPQKFLKRIDEAYKILDLDFPIDLLVYTPEEIEKMKEKKSIYKKGFKRRDCSV